MPVPGFETLFVYDVIHQWREMTGQTRRARDLGGTARRDHAGSCGRFHGVASSTASSTSAKSPKPRAIKLDLPPRALERYLTENIHFDLDEDNLAGLQLYFEKAAAAGLIPRAKPLEFPQAAARSTAHRGA